MGFECDRFECLVDEELVCSICSGVFDDPVQIESCEHTFCRNCIKQWCVEQSVCPVDRTVITPNQLHAVPRIIRNMLSRLRIKCNNYAHGCLTHLSLEELYSHSKNCEFDPKRPVPCSRGCGLSVPKDELGAHNCARDLQIMVTDLQLNVQELRNIVERQEKIMEDMRQDVNQMKEFIMAIRIVHPNLRVLLERNDRDELIMWSRTLRRTRVSLWSNMLPVPDHQSKLFIKNALMESNCPERIMEALANNCHERRWPAGLATQAAREESQELLDDYICRRLPEQMVLVVLSVDNCHMGEDMMTEPGITICFRNGFN